MKLILSEQSGTSFHNGNSESSSKIVWSKTARAWSWSLTST